MEKVGTVKCLAVGLVHCQNIFFAIEDLNLFKRVKVVFINVSHNIIFRCHLIGNLRSAPDKVSLSGDGDISHSCGHIHCLIAVSVPEDDVGNPK